MDSVVDMKQKSHQIHQILTRPIISFHFRVSIYSLWGLKIRNLHRVRPSIHLNPPILKIIIKVCHKSASHYSSTHPSLPSGYKNHHISPSRLFHPFLNYQTPPSFTLVD
ncbi:hypothetical protein EYC84_000313 [Monilinia fructicola]|uniref:Uncharacterized protein n=1 Tax=Monilinia fructicola TaxID=38448 RepID=A0A5M9JR96_MONFR|nr:hypothetical protein EYC84_000313 [Monilinia fructicola]